MRLNRILIVGILFSLSVFAESTNSLSLNNNHTPQLIKIGSGLITGVYHPTAKLICKIIESESKYKCQVIATKGTIENLKLLKQGNIDLALVQSDLANDAYLGNGSFKNNKQFDDLRIIVSLFEEDLTFIKRKDEHINSINDLKNKKILVASKHLISPFPLTLFAKFYNWQEKNYPILVVDSSDAPENLICDKKIDAIYLTMQHPNGFTNQIAGKCEVDFIGLDQELINFLKNKRPYGNKKSIYNNLYPGIKHEIATVSILSLLVAKKDVSDELIQKIIQGLVKNKFTKENILPDNNNLNFRLKIDQDISIPLHKESQKILSR